MKTTFLVLASCALLGTIGCGQRGQGDGPKIGPPPPPPPMVTQPPVAAPSAPQGAPAAEVRANLQLGVTSAPVSIIGLDGNNLPRAGSLWERANPATAQTYYGVTPAGRLRSATIGGALTVGTPTQPCPTGATCPSACMLVASPLAMTPAAMEAQLFAAPACHIANPVQWQTDQFDWLEGAQLWYAVTQGANTVGRMSTVFRKQVGSQGTIKYVMELWELYGAPTPALWQPAVTTGAFREANGAASSPIKFNVDVLLDTSTTPPTSRVPVADAQNAAALLNGKYVMILYPVP